MSRPPVPWHKLHAGEISPMILIFFGGAFLAVAALFVFTARRLDRARHNLDLITENRDYWFKQSQSWERIAWAFYIPEPEMSEVRPIADNLIPSFDWVA